jgi:hypothetical protein
VTDPNRKTIALDELDRLSIDATNGDLYWDDRKIATQSKVSLRTAEFVLAAVASLSTLVAASWPIWAYFNPPT